MVPIILENSGFNPRKKINLDFVYLISDSTTIGPPFHHVKRIWIHDTLNEGPKVEESEITGTKSKRNLKCRFC